jgi:phosphatidylinositol glycan class K
MCRHRRQRPRLLLLAHAALALAAAMACTAAGSSGSAHSGDTWAVILSSSRYWLNYRHSANALAVYQAVRRLGLPDSRILLMLADQPGCSPRNVHPGQLYLSPGGRTAGDRSTTNATCAGDDASGLPGNLLAGDVEVDFRGRETSVDALLRVLTGRHPAGTPASKRLDSGPTSRVLLYLTGHGGDEFLKFHDQEELLAADLASAVRQMAAAGRYGELLLLADTCQVCDRYAAATCC